MLKLCKIPYLFCVFFLCVFLLWLGIQWFQLAVHFVHSQDIATTHGNLNKDEQVRGIAQLFLRPSKCFLGFLHEGLPVKI